MPDPFHFPPVAGNKGTDSDSHLKDLFGVEQASPGGIFNGGG